MRRRNLLTPQILNPRHDYVKSSLEHLGGKPCALHPQTPNCRPCTLAPQPHTKGARRQPLRANHSDGRPPQPVEHPKRAAASKHAKEIINAHRHPRPPKMRDSAPPPPRSPPPPPLHDHRRRLAPTSLPHHPIRYRPESARHSLPQKTTNKSAAGRGSQGSPWSKASVAAIGGGQGKVRSREYFDLNPKPSLSYAPNTSLSICSGADSTPSSYRLPPPPPK